MSASRRFELLDWAKRRRSWIIKDDYDSEYRYASRPIGALQGVDTGSQVIYIGAFSKVLFPSLRLGYVVVPPPLLNKFIRLRDTLDLFSPQREPALGLLYEQEAEERLCLTSACSRRDSCSRRAAKTWFTRACARLKRAVRPAAWEPVKDTV